MSGEIVRPCRACGERTGRRRGLCLPCYDRVRRTVRTGETTWAELEATGRALPAKSRGEMMGDWLRTKARPPPADE
jgi:hypothetical protein